MDSLLIKKLQSEAVAILDANRKVKPWEQQLTSEVAQKYIREGYSQGNVTCNVGFVMGYIQSKLLSPVVDKKRAMTFDEMEARWPACPPFDANNVDIWYLDPDHDATKTKRIFKQLDQDTIQDIIEYFRAVEEVLNG